MRTGIDLPLGIRVSRSIILGTGTAIVAALAAYVPEHAGLAFPGRHALFVLLTAASWWTTAVMPPFAVSLAVIAMQVALLGDPSGPWADGDPARWQRFVSPWASPVMWIFLGGLTLAAAATRSGLDRLVAERVLHAAGATPPRVLLAVMGLTFALSMFMSNTATTAMMVALVLALPALASPHASDAPGPTDAAARTASALLLGIPIAANVGGMATLIGTPPNAIAVAALSGSGRLDFAGWMLYGLPPALLLGAVSWWWLTRRYLVDAAPLAIPPAPQGSAWSGRQRFVAALFVLTVLAWLTEAWHGVPTAVVAVMPMAALAVGGVLRERDVRALPWDVLMLIAGGLSLGVGVSETGLAAWIVGRLPADLLPLPLLALLLTWVGLLLSTFISNTAAATILLPLAVALAGDAPRLVAVPMALGMSAAMSLPVSTPPNAIAFATDRIPRDALRAVGLRLALVAPPVLLGWTWVMERVLR